jgi:hypothetical protein
VTRPHASVQAELRREALTRPWRVGRRVGRTVYYQLGERPSDEDLLIGVMDTRALAREVVDAHNGALR